MARYETKVKEGAAPYLEQGEEVVAAVMAGRAGGLRPAHPQVAAPPPG
jgi:hypothetical protein